MPELREAGRFPRRSLSGAVIAALLLSGTAALAVGAATGPAAPGPPGPRPRPPYAASTAPPPGRAEAHVPASARPAAEAATARGPGWGEPSPDHRTAAPRRIEIGTAGLDAAVVPVGVRDDGRAEIPDAPAQAGWYRFGPAPGDPEGSAVLMGHVDSRTGGLGAFAALVGVRPGDRVVIRRTGAPSVLYRVVSSAQVDKERLPPSVFARTGRPVLTLITCAPPYDPDAGGYRKNLVVTAVPL
ncbi:class F sortase [Streptomyces globisporus]|uniref:class F sortase n=1 Tax=Streptomyces globisporus TaxID=1908 RepID=UPI0004C4D406|nr:class F sortase [Streptomyces globisporus]